MHVSQVRRSVAASLLTVALCCGCGESRDERREVLIIYANETAPNAAETENLDTTIEWLQSSDHAKAPKIAGQLKDDRALFPAEVDDEIAAIRGALPHMPPGLDVVIFTNRSVRAGKFVTSRSGERCWNTHPIRPIPSDNYILTSNPQSNPLMLERALDEVARRYDPERHQFILVTKSHGGSELALTPRWAVRRQDTNREELLAVVDEEIPDSQLPSWCDRTLGITKQRYFEILDQAGRSHGMTFSLVLMESCKGGLAEEGRLPNNVRRLYATLDQECGYYSVDYAQLLAGEPGQTPVSQVMGVMLEPKFNIIMHRSLPYHAVFYYLPLTLFASCWFLHGVQRKRASCD